MTLSAGSRLGPYEVIAPLGAGGMGEVYQARDPRLGRDVAIKVLPAALASDSAEAVRAGGAIGVVAQSPQHRDDLRDRLGRLGLLHRDGASGGGATTGRENSDVVLIDLPPR